MLSLVEAEPEREVLPRLDDQRDDLLVDSFLWKSISRTGHRQRADYVASVVANRRGHRPDVAQVLAAVEREAVLRHALQVLVQRAQVADRPIRVPLESVAEQMT